MTKFFEISFLIPNQNSLKKFFYQGQVCHSSTGQSKDTLRSKGRKVSDVLMFHNQIMMFLQHQKSVCTVKLRQLVPCDSLETKPVVQMWPWKVTQASVKLSDTTNMGECCWTHIRSILHLILNCCLDIVHSETLAKFSQTVMQSRGLRLKLCSEKLTFHKKIVCLFV